MKCKYCKSEIPDELHFSYCGYCGEKLQRDRKKKDEIKIPTPRKRGQKWYVDLRREGVTVIENTEAEAKAKAVAIRAGFVECHKVSKRTVGECVDNYINARDGVLSPSTIRGYRRIRRTRFTALMERKLSELTNTIVQNDIKQECRFEISSKTLSDAYSLIKTACVAADIECAPAFVGVVLPKVQPAVYTTLTIEQISKLIQNLHRSECELELLIAIWLGLRRSEILALQKSDFDFSNKTLTVSSAEVENSDNRYVRKGAKNASSVRVISCPQIILDKVAQLPDGKIYRHSPDYMRRCLQRLCEQLDIPCIRLHDLRHINASIMAITMTDKYSMERGGWSSRKTMQGRYQHLFDVEKKAADKRTDEFFDSLLNGSFTTNFTTK